MQRIQFLQIRGSKLAVDGGNRFKPERRCRLARPSRSQQSTTSLADRSLEDGCGKDETLEEVVDLSQTETKLSDELLVTKSNDEQSRLLP